MKYLVSTVLLPASSCHAQVIPGGGGAGEWGEAAFLSGRSLRRWNPQPYKNINDQALIPAEGLRLIILRTVET